MRGIRTLGEVAHFVRCIPFKNHEVSMVWSSPDFLLTMRIGSIDEHALLMASMFRAVKFESIEDIDMQYKHKKLIATEKSKRLLAGTLGDIEEKSIADDPNAMEFQKDEADNNNNDEKATGKKLKIDKINPVIDSRLI